MLRTQISLTEEQRRTLDAASARTGRSIAALIRDAVDSTFGSEHSVEDDLDGMREAFGSWNAHELDGAAWVERMRSGGRLQPGT
jgi:hypothetical protein